MSATALSDREKNVANREWFDRLAEDREYWQSKNSYYSEDKRQRMRFLIPERLRVLEIGCKLGDLLAPLEPSRGLGVDLSDMDGEGSTVDILRWNFSSASAKGWIWMRHLMSPYLRMSWIIFLMSNRA